jgi:hypothetical protein
MAAIVEIEDRIKSLTDAYFKLRHPMLTPHFTSVTVEKLRVRGLRLARGAWWDCPGVYYYISPPETWPWPNNVAYVGKSRCLGERTACHLREWGLTVLIKNNPATVVGFILANTQPDTGSWIHGLESRLLRVLKPLWNIRGKRGFAG